MVERKKTNLNSEIISICEDYKSASNKIHNNIIFYTNAKTKDFWPNINTNDEYIRWIRLRETCESKIINEIKNATKDFI